MNRCHPGLAPEPAVLRFDVSVSYNTIMPPTQLLHWSRFKASMTFGVQFSQIKKAPRGEPFSCLVWGSA